MKLTKQEELEKKFKILIKTFYLQENNSNNPFSFDTVDIEIDGLTNRLMKEVTIFYKKGDN